MRFLLLGLVIIPTQVAIGQYFGLESSVWVYEWDDPTSSDGGHYNIYFHHDTVLAGLEAKVFYNGRTHCIPQPVGDCIWITQNVPYSILRFSGDSVFHWKDSTFYLLYDFNAEIGDSWIANVQDYIPGCPDTAWVEVVDTGTTLIGGEFLRYIDIVSTNDSETALQGRAVERLGLIGGGIGQNPEHQIHYAGFAPGYGCLVNPYVIVDYYLIGSLCSYADAVVGELNPNSLYCPQEVGVYELSFEDFGEVLPNPSSGIFTLELTNQIGHSLNYSILDSQGRTVLNSSSISDSRIEIDLSDQPNGLYLLQIVGEEMSETSRLVKR